MYLYLTETSPLNSTFSTATGQVIYKIETPVTTSTLTRFVSSPKGAVDEIMQENYVPFAKIDWEHMNNSSSSLLSFASESTKHECMSMSNKTRTGFWTRHNVFTGPDGKEYQWKNSCGGHQLILGDGSKTIIAHFRKPIFWNMLGRKRAPELEIRNDGLKMAELIVTTLIYMENQCTLTKRDKIYEASSFITISLH